MEIFVNNAIISTHSAHEDGDLVNLGAELMEFLFQPTPPTRTETN